MRKNNFLLLIILFFISCNKKSNKYDYEQQIINKHLESYFIQNKKAIIFIPISGCGSCVKNIISFSKSLENKKNIGFVIEEESLKKIKAIYHNKTEDSIVYLIDKKMKFTSMKILENSPVLFFLKNKKITKKIIIQNDNSIAIINTLKSL